MNVGLYSEEGDTYLVEILSREINTISIRRLMTSDGYLTDDFEPEAVYSQQLVSDIPYRDISPKILYHFSSNRIGEKVKAASFVTHGKPLVSTCSHGLGSGIYGLYFHDINEINRYKSNPKQIVYAITCLKPFIIQDAAHLNSLINASMSTNRYIDDIIKGLQNNYMTYEIIKNTIQQNPIDNLALLWYIVFARSNRPISYDKVLLEGILSHYLWEYYTDDGLRDSLTNAIIHELPINHIMRIYDYDGIIGDDRETNSWSRGCLSFDYSFAQFLEGYGSRQCISN